MVIEFTMINSAAGDDLSNSSSPSITVKEFDVARKTSLEHLFDEAGPESDKEDDSRSKRFSL
jgi:hypothetical protein